MAAKRRRRIPKAKQRRRQHGKGIGKKIKTLATKAATKFIPGLSKGKKGNPKVTTAEKVKLAGDLIVGALGGPVSFATQLLLNGQKIGTLLGTNYKGPVGVPKIRGFHPTNSQYGWGFLMGNPAGLRRRRRRR